MRLALLLSVLLALPTAAQDWTALSIGTTGTLRAIENTSFSPRYIVGDGGFVAQSNTDQTVWTSVSVGTSADLYSVMQPAFGQAWVGGAGGAVRVRDNTGTWSVRNVPSAETFYLFTRSSGVALAAGNGGSIWKSLNLGVNWTQHYSGTTPLRAGVGGTFGDGWVVGDGGTLLKGTSNGTVWTPVASGTTEDLHAVRFTAGNGIMAVGANGAIIRSLDNGATWLHMESGTSRTLRDLSTSKANSNWMIAVGDDGVVVRSENNGATWCRLTTGVTDDLYATEMASNSRYVVAGENGTLLRTETSGGTCVLGIDATLLRIGTGSIPAAGGPLQFTVALQNPSPEAQAFQAWVEAVLPDGTVFGPFLGPQQLTFAPGQSVGPITFTQNVPAAAPSGNYRVRLRVGNFSTGGLLDESTFLFSKSTVAPSSLGYEGGLQTVGWGTQPTFITEPPAEVQASAATPVLSQVQPNPAQDRAQVTLAVDEAQSVTAEVFDMQGRRVALAFEGTVSAGHTVTVPLDARALPPGVYIVRVRGTSFVESRRLVVVR